MSCTLSFVWTSCPVLYFRDNSGLFFEWPHFCSQINIIPSHVELKCKFKQMRGWGVGWGGCETKESPARAPWSHSEECASTLITTAIISAETWNHISRDNNSQRCCSQSAVKNNLSGWNGGKCINLQCLFSLSAVTPRWADVVNLWRTHAALNYAVIVLH